jgi:hypothetical protein
MKLSIEKWKGGKFGFEIVKHPCTTRTTFRAARFGLSLIVENGFFNKPAVFGSFCFFLGVFVTYFSK